MYRKLENFALHERPEKCPYSEFFWSIFSRIRTEYRPERFQIQILFTQWNKTSNTLILLTGNDQGNFKLSKNIKFEKEI